PRLSLGRFWLLPSSPSSMRPSAEQCLKPELPIGAPAAAGAEGAEGADAAAGGASAAAAGAPIDAADPGGGPEPEPGGGLMQPPSANAPTASVPTRRVFLVVVVMVVVLVL